LACQDFGTPGGLFFTWCSNKNPLTVVGKGVFINLEGSKRFQPHEPPHDPELQLPPPPSGLVEVIEKPERFPAPMKSTLTAPHFSRRSWSTRKVKPPSSKVLSLLFDSSRAKPKDGPLQPPCIRAIRIAELILF